MLKTHRLNRIEKRALVNILANMELSPPKQPAREIKEKMRLIKRQM